MIIELCEANRISQLTLSTVQAALKRLRDDNLSLQTCNHYLRSIKQFTRWLWRDGRTREDALVHMSGFNVMLDRRHDRRALTDDEMARLIQAAEQGPVVHGMSGPDRAMLYRLALGTGFRAGELASLTPESFDLEADPPMVTILAAYSKRRRQDEQPIRRDLADALAPWLESRPPGQPVFSMPHKPVELIKADLAAARQAWLNEGRRPEDRKEREESDFLAYRDSAGRVADFHGLRHTYVSRLVQSGANVKVAQELARHSTPTLTLARYAHIGLVDRTKALDALPTIEQPKPEQQAAESTGTNDLHAQVAGVGADEPTQGRSAIAASRDPDWPFAAIERQDRESQQDGKQGPQPLVEANACAHLPTTVINTRDRNRTCNLRFRRPMLYPIELRAHPVAHDRQQVCASADDARRFYATARLLSTAASRQRNHCPGTGYCPFPIPNCPLPR